MSNFDLGRRYAKQQPNNGRKTMKKLECFSNLFSNHFPILTLIKANLNIM